MVPASASFDLLARLSSHIGLHQLFVDGAGEPHDFRILFGLLFLAGQQLQFLGFRQIRGDMSSLDVFRNSTNAS